MARVTKLGNNRPVWIWDVDQRVAVGVNSRRPDVMLVQVALNKLIRALDLRDERKPFNPAPENPLLGRVHGYPPLSFLEVDGSCGPETRYATVQFQKKSVPSRDGAVDPVYPIVDNGVYYNRTMYSLNYQILMKYGRMMDESEFPPLLRADVSRF